jgi:hypothetical protein
MYFLQLPELTAYGRAVAKIVENTNARATFAMPEDMECEFIGAAHFNKVQAPALRFALFANSFKFPGARDEGVVVIATSDRTENYVFSALRGRGL